MSKASEFDGHELIELFKLGDKFLATGQAKENILSLFVKYLSSEKVENVHEMQRFNLWYGIINYLKSNPTIEIDKYSIKLNGLNVNPEKKEETFILLGNLAKNYRVLYIRDIPLCSNDLKVIYPNLTKLHIENCPFNFEEQFDLSQLTRLTHFTCSNCFADCHLLFTLESLTSSLDYLDISDNLLNPIGHSPLVDWIEKQKLLKHLNLSGNNLNIISAPSLFNVLFSHPSLEVLNLANNYLIFEFSKQLSSFPGTPNWKSLSINNFGKLLKDSDLLPSCFSKLKRLKYLDMSDKYDKLDVQKFLSSLCKGISKLRNLKNFFFNSSPNSHYSSEIESEIEKLFRKNPNVSLYLKKHTIKSFEDWKLSRRHHGCEHNKSIEDGSIKDVSKSTYRHIYFCLKSSNNEPSQIENLISKFKGVEQLRICVVGERYKNNIFDYSEDIFPPSIKFFLLYKTEKDLENILFCCKKYLKPIYFLFKPLRCPYGHLWDFIFETKSSLYWESIEELELVNCDITVILKIITEINLPNLKSLYLKNFRFEYKAYKFFMSEVKNYSLQRLTLRVDKNEKYDESLGVLFNCFPNMIEFKVILFCNLLADFPIEKLPRGLRNLLIYAPVVPESLAFLNHLSIFPLLSKFNLVISWNDFPNPNLNDTIYLPNLTELFIDNRVFMNSTFVLPELRKFTSYLADNLSVDKLEKFKKLKKINFKSSLEGVIQKIFDSNLLLELPYLNEFYCDECGNLRGEFTFDFVSDKISNSLIHLNIPDKNNDYNQKNEIAKKLQKKNLPFLYKYDSGIGE